MTWSTMARPARPRIGLAASTTASSIILLLAAVPPAADRTPHIDTDDRTDRQRTCVAARHSPTVLHGSSARIRRQASRHADVLGLLYPTHTLRAQQRRHKWIKVTDVTTGITGWVSGNLVHRDDPRCTD